MVLITHTPRFLLTPFLGVPHTPVVVLLVFLSLFHALPPYPLLVCVWCRTEVNPRCYPFKTCLVCMCICAYGVLTCEAVCGAKASTSGVLSVVFHLKFLSQGLSWNLQPADLVSLVNQEAWESQDQSYLQAPATVQAVV